MPRKVKVKYHYLYRTTNLINKKYYIGVHSTYEIKDGYLGSGTKLWNSIYKYGKENFIKEELEFFKTREELLQREKEVVNEQLINDPLCMNLQPGGGGGFSSKEHNLKCSTSGGKACSKRLKSDKKLRKQFAENFAKIGREKFLNDNIRCDWVGRKHSNNAKEKIGKANSINQQGEKNSQYGTCWVYNNELKTNKKIKLEELKDYLKKNYIKGRKNFNF